MKMYTFIVNYRQNMELPIFRKEEQSGCIYYFSLVSVYNLGVVNHTHVSEHLHAHVYHKGVEKKGVNNVASLIIKMCNN